MLAGTKEQARIVFDEAAAMIAAEDSLKYRLKVKRSAQAIEDRQRNSEIRIISSSPQNAAGHNPTAVFVDELASHGSHAREIWDHFTASMIARENSLLFVISHAGFGIETLGHEQFNYARAVQSGEIIDTSLYPSVWTIPKDLDWHDSDNWHLANPSLGHTVRLSALQDLYHEAKNNPAKQAAFQTLHANRFVGSAESWLPFDVWDNLGQDELTLEDFAGEDCTIGIDASRTTDLTVYCLCFKRDNRYFVFPRFFVPEAKANNKSQQKDIFDYRNKPNVTVTQGETHDAKALIESIKEADERFNILEVSYDPYAMETTRQILEDDYGLPMVAVPQTVSHMPDLVELTFRTIDAGLLRHPRCECLNWCVSNCRPVDKGNERIMLEKASDKSRIDGAIAMVLAVGRMEHYQDNDLSGVLAAIL